MLKGALGCGVFGFCGTLATAYNFDNEASTKTLPLIMTALTMGFLFFIAALAFGGIARLFGRKRS